MDTMSYLLGKNSSGGGGADISEYLGNEMKILGNTEGVGNTTVVTTLIKKLPENIIIDSKVDSLANAFYSCINMVSIPLFDTSNIKNFYGTFTLCINLVDVPLFNTSNVTSMANAFYGCSSLSNESLNNILAMCTNATSYADTKTLKSLDLTSKQANICKTLSNYQAFLDAGWTTGY